MFYRNSNAVLYRVLVVLVHAFQQDGAVSVSTRRLRIVVDLRYLSNNSGTVRLYQVATVVDARFCPISQRVSVNALVRVASL